MSRAVKDWLRYSPWPRWLLLRLSDYLPARLEEQLCDFLYPDDMGVAFEPAADKDGAR